jgi:hypothetical protein
MYRAVVCLLPLAACATAGIPGEPTNAVVTLISADAADGTPGGVVTVTQGHSDVAPVDEPDRVLGDLGFGGSLVVTLSQGVHGLYATGELLAHPGCEDPAEPQSSCSPAGWDGVAFVEVYGPDWDGSEVDSTVDVSIAAGDVGTVEIPLAAICVCTD